MDYRSSHSVMKLREAIFSLPVAQRLHAASVLLSLLLVLMLLSQQASAVPDTNQSPLKIANSKAWKPFSYLDENGQPQGMLIDYWREYSKITEQPVEFILTDWQKSLDLVRNGRADIHAGLLWSEARDKYLDYADSLSKLDSQLFYASTLLGTDPEEYLRSGQLGVVTGGFEESFAREHFPATDIITFANNEQMMLAAFSGNLKAFIADLQVANFYLYTSNNPAQFIPVRHLYSETIFPAVQQGNTALLKQINSGLAQISAADRERIRRKWMHVETVYPDYLWQTATLLISLIIAVYIYQLRRTVAVRTQALRAANTELNRLASTDALTGITNRRRFLELFDQRCKEDSDHSISLILFDIDHFKGINDNYGHLVGDQVITAVAGRVEKLRSKSMVFARIGGEEFCILISDANAHETETLAATVRQSVAQPSVATDGGALPVTISIGAVLVAAGQPINPQQLLNQADRLMYQAKQQGRNQYCFSQIS